MNTVKTYSTLPEALGFFTAFEIGFELLPPPGDVNANSLLQTIFDHPNNHLDIILSGLTEVAESMPPDQAIHEIRGFLYGVAAYLDRDTKGVG